MEMLSKYKSIVPFLLFLSLWIYSSNLSAQKIPILSKPQVDSAYVDLLWDKWSLRLFSQINYQTLKLSSSESGSSLKYRPNNLLGIGFGFTYKLLLLDFAFALKLQNETPSTGFGIGVNFGIGNHHNIRVNYQGFSGFDRVNAPFENAFRDDIQSRNISLRYHKSFRDDRLLMRSVSSSDQINKASAASFFVGSFLTYHLVNSDASLIPADLSPEFNAEANWTRACFIDIGVTGGTSFIFNVVEGLYLFGRVAPGIGVNFGNIQSSTNYTTPIGPSGILGIQGAVGYASEHFYITASAVADFTWNVIGSGNRYGYNQGTFKLAIGKRFGSTVAVLEKMSDSLERN